MQIFEINNDIAKILYNPAENRLFCSDFILIDDKNQKHIAQIINISSTENPDKNLAEAKLSLSFDLNNTISYYNGNIPLKSSNVIYVKPDEIIELLKSKTENIYFGNLSNHYDCFVNTSISFINDKVYIRSDNDVEIKTTVKNIISELDEKQKKVILVDFDGSYSSLTNASVLKISENFKLPLNIGAFMNISEYDTTDCPLEDKAAVQAIVLELREYINTLEDKFIPFSLFKNVVDSEFETNPVSGLMLLKNKLKFYEQEQIFAEDKSQFDIVNSLFSDKNVLVLDVSDLEERWHEFALQTLLSLTDCEVYLFMQLNSVNFGKKFINNLYNSSQIIPVISTNYESEYSQIIKSKCKNRISFKTSNYLQAKNSDELLLDKIKENEFIMYGDSTLYLSLILKLRSFDKATAAEVVQNEIKKDVDKLLASSGKNMNSAMVDKNSPEINNSCDLINDDINDDDLDFIEELTGEQLKDEIIQEYGENLEEENIASDDEIADIDDVINDITSEYEETIEQETVNNEEETIETVEEETQTQEDTEEEIQEYTEEETEEKDQDEEFNNEETENEETAPEINTNINTKNSPELTIYETDNSSPVSINDIPFKIGDKVYHPKHGKGVIEGFANYSDKIIFCRIKFVNVGIRILDPRIAGIEKI